MTTPTTDPTFGQIVDLLSDIYRPEGVLVWLQSNHPLLGGERAIDVIARGDFATVVNLINALRDGAFA